MCGSCVGDALLMSRECRGEVSVIFQYISMMSQRWFSDVLVMLFVMSRFCLGGVSVMSWVCVSDVSVWLG